MSSGDDKDSRAASGDGNDTEALQPGMICNMGLVENAVMTEVDWKQRWMKGRDCSWQVKTVHPMLQKHYERMTGGRSDSRVLVPLCGRTLDLNWLLEKGHSVVGVEMVEMGVVKYLTESQYEYTVEPGGPLMPDGAKVFTACEGRLKIINADFFRLRREGVGAFDCIWDRGALAATNPAYWDRYFATIYSLLDDSGIWMIDSFNYSNPEFHGPPFVFNAKNITDSLGSHYDIEQLDLFPNDVEKYKKWGLVDFHEMVHILSKKKSNGPSANGPSRSN